MKTTNNCYVAQKNLYSKPDISNLDPCGPVPLLEIADHNNENGTSEVNKRDKGPRLISELEERATHYLENVTIGEEYSYCRSCADDPCNIEKTYEFNQEVLGNTVHVALALTFREGLLLHKEFGFVGNARGRL
jgi:hypothetical protein